MAKVKRGEGACPACGERIVWRESDSGALSCFCQDCDFQGYAKEGTEAKRLILAKIGAAALAAPNSRLHEQQKEPKPEPKKVDEKPKPGLFGGLGL